MNSSFEKDQERAVPNVVLSTIEAREATEAEIRELPHVTDHVPFAAWAAAIIGAIERFGYYSTVITWRELSLKVILNVANCMMR